MANKIILKKSSVVGKIPTTGDLDYGEVALNYADGRLYFKTSTNEIDYFNTGIDDVVQIANGGTGATTRADAINNLLPVQSASAGLYLTTDGTNVSWSEISSGVGNINSSIVFKDGFLADGSTTTFELSVAPPNENAVFVSINGVLQDTSAYSIAGSSLVFSSAPADDDSIDIRTVTVVSTSLSLRDFQKYIYNISSTTDTVTGADINGLTLAYETGKLDVYQNGIRLVEGLDYTAVDKISIVFTVDLDNGDTVEVLSYAAAFFLENPIVLDFEELTTTVANQTVDSYNKTLYRTAKYLIQAVAAGHVHSTEVLLTHNDTDVFITEYATIYSSTNPLITVTGEIVSNTVLLKVTPANANTTVDLARIALVARTL
jgi:hypothetical protein